MAADFVQERQQEVAMNHSLESCTEHTVKSADDTKSRYFCGEVVVAGANPGVLISRTRVWRDGKEMVTEVPGLFPPGVVSHLTPATTHHQGVGLGARVWEVLCSATMLTFGLGAKLVLRGLNTTVVHGRENMDLALTREQGKPLLSVTNHKSCFDDPGIWGAVLRPRQLADTVGMRWGASASEVIFPNMALATFFSLGKVVPIVRGWGVYQPAMEFLLQRLSGGGWVNIFPEARVNADGGYIRYKWGVGRLVWDCTTSPLFLPVVHLGMDRVLPNPGVGEMQSAIVRPCNLVTVNIGAPVDMGDMVDRLRQAGVDAVEARRFITQQVQDMMAKLYSETKEKHCENVRRWLARWHDQTDVVPSILT